jgi:ribosome biogenesis protein MAK21
VTLTSAVQACCSLPANVACGIVILLAEASKTNVAVAQGMARALAPRAADADCDDEEEVFKDAPDSDDERAPLPAPVKAPAKVVSASLYNPRCPAPEHAAATGVPLFELAPLFNHYHPSVTALISAFIKRKVTPSGDPLKDLTPGSFLDKFVFRKPKKRGQAGADDEDGSNRGGSIMQPLADSSTRPATDILSRAFQAIPLDEAQPDERFFIRFFQERRGRAAKARREKKKKGTEEEEEAEEGLNDLLGGALDDSESDDDDDDFDGEGDGRRALPGDESDEEVEFSDGDDDFDDDDGSVADWAGSESPLPIRTAAADLLM